jgi:hypothetical protein
MNFDFVDIKLLRYCSSKLAQQCPTPFFGRIAAQMRSPNNEIAFADFELAQ